MVVSEKGTFLWWLVKRVPFYGGQWKGCLFMVVSEKNAFLWWSVKKVVPFYGSKKGAFLWWQWTGYLFMVVSEKGTFLWWSVKRVPFYGGQWKGHLFMVVNEMGTFFKVVSEKGKCFGCEIQGPALSMLKLKCESSASTSMLAMQNMDVYVNEAGPCPFV